MLFGANEVAIKDLLMAHKKIEAIKKYREIHECGLREAKLEIERMEMDLGLRPKFAFLASTNNTVVFVCGPNGMKTLSAEEAYKWAH